MVPISSNRNPLLRLGRIVLFALLFVAVTLFAYQAIGREIDRRSYRPPGELVDVGEGRLHLHCTGEGSPTVILDAGGGDTSLAWWDVQREIGPMSRVCSFDRMGFGWSDSFPREHTLSDYLSLQESMLESAGVEGPYLLVGHSLGGLNAQFFASNRPDDVAGMVLVDSASAGLYERVPELADSGDSFVRSMQILTRLGVARLILDLGLVDPLEGYLLSPEAKEMYLAEYSRPRHWDSTAKIGSNLGEILEEAREMESLPNVPAVIITHGVPEPYEGVDPEEVERHWQELQEELADRFPRGRLKVAEQSGHMIPMEEPEVVVEAVAELLGSL